MVIDYDVRYTAAALESLKAMPRHAQVEVIKAILTNQPDQVTRRIKRLRNIPIRTIGCEPLIGGFL